MAHRQHREMLADPATDLCDAKLPEPPSRFNPDSSDAPMGTQSNTAHISTSKPTSTALFAASAEGTAALFSSFLFRVLRSMKEGDGWRADGEAMEAGMSNQLGNQSIVLNEEEKGNAGHKSQDRQLV